MCSAPKCKFETVAALDCLVDHCVNSHRWKDSPCSFPGCNFVSYSSRTALSHRTRFHSKHRVFSLKDFPCLWSNCVSSFPNQSLLKKHMRIHNNELLKCTFCPYRTAMECHLKDHYRTHYKIFDFKCEFCEKSFVATHLLQQHTDMAHSKDEDMSCEICNKFTGPRGRLQRHIRQVHNLLSRWNETERSLQTFERS